MYAVVFSAHAAGSREYLAVDQGQLLLTVDPTAYQLSRGDSIYYAGDCAHAFANPRRWSMRVLPGHGCVRRANGSH